MMARANVSASPSMPEDLLGVGALGDARPAGSQRIEEYEVGVAQERLRVILERCVGAQVVETVGCHALGADASEVDGYRGGSGAAVVCEGDGACGIVLAVLVDHRIAEREHLADEGAGILAHVDVRSGDVVAQLLSVRAMPRELLARRCGHLGCGVCGNAQKLGLLLLGRRLLCHMLPPLLRNCLFRAIS